MFALNLDTDLLVFLVTVGTMLTSSLPNLRRTAIPIPADCDFEELSPEALTEKQRQFLEPYDKKLAALNYHPVLTYHIKNYGMNLVHRYINPGDPAAFMIIIVAVKTKVGSVESVNQSAFFNFMTEFADGKSLTTRNMKLKTLLDQPPELLVQDCPYVDDPAALKNRHDTRARSLGTPLPAPSDAARVFDLYQKQHHRFSDYQVERGSYLRTNTGYLVSDKTFWRGIRNFLVPFAERFSTPKLLLAAILGTGIPSVTCLKLLPMALHEIQALGAPAAPSLTLILAASYVLAGAIVGLLLDTNVFIWAFLFTYVGVHLITGWWPSFIPYGAIAAVAAYYATQLSNRQRLILRPAVVPIANRRI
ncbi:MAG TPA: hypothetical protein VOA41_06770 [Candidatus Dormibacteraeota bacterium]|nr:hypothetical protein [Candidatus Dormibacteraeota bacterium]